MYTGTTPAAARGIAPELLKAPDRRRTLASAGLLFFSYLYIYIYIYIAVFCCPHNFFSILFTYYFLSFQTEKGSLAFLFIFFFFLFFSIFFLLYIRNAQSIIRRINLLDSYPHPHTHTHYTQQQQHHRCIHRCIYTLYFALANFWLKTFGIFFFITVKYEQEEELSYMRSTKTPWGSIIPVGRTSVI